MEKVELFKENNKVIKTVTNFEDFKDVIRVFCKEPYYEILSDKDCEEEYNLYVEKGRGFFRHMERSGRRL